MLVFLGSVAKIYPNLSDGAELHALGDCAKKCQQSFLAPLPGKTLVKKNLVGYDHDHMHER